MKDEYDCANAERGKFYKPNLRLIAHLRLVPQVLDFWRPVRRLRAPL